MQHVPKVNMEILFVEVSNDKQRLIDKCLHINWNLVFHNYNKGLTIKKQKPHIDKSTKTPLKRKYNSHYNLKKKKPYIQIH